MSWLRRKLRAWLGIPNADQIAYIAQREIDADAVWREGVEPHQAMAATFQARRERKENERWRAILSGGREDARA